MGPHPKVLGELISILDSIVKLADRRNDVLHAAWNTILEATGRLPGTGIPDPNWAYLFKQQGRTLKQFAIGATGIEQIASEIADARFAINRLLLPISRGTLRIA